MGEQALGGAPPQAEDARAALQVIVDDSELTNFNSDGDELTGCRWCETLWGGHTESCPILGIEKVLERWS